MDWGPRAHKQEKVGASENVQWAKVLAPEPTDINWIYMVEEENQ